MVNLDRFTQKTLNGYFSNKIIAESVPNLDDYKNICSYVRLWARLRGLYSHIIGFFSGISLSVMVGKL